MKKATLFCLLGLLMTSTSFSQVFGELNVLDRDVFYIHYTPPLFTDSKFDYQKISTRISVPPIRFKKLSIFNTLGFDYHHFNYNSNPDLNDTKTIENFYNANVNNFISYKLTDKLSLNASLSTYLLFNDNVGIDDIKFNGNLFFEKRFDRKNGGYFLLDLGVNYITLNGSTIIIPLTNLKARLNEKWSFTVGVPNSYLKMDINQKHSLKLLAELNGFSAEINSPFDNDSEKVKAEFSNINAGLEYTYWLRPSWGLMLRGTHSLYDLYELRNTSNETLYSFNSTLKPYIVVGIKFNPIRSIQNNLNYSN